MSADSEQIVLDPERAARALAETAPSILADMAFMDAAVMDAAWGASSDAAGADVILGADPASGPPVHIAIDMLKPLSCRLEMRFPRALADRINETLYGDAAVAGVDGAGDDSTLELLNVLAGSFLSAYFGPGSVFKLELPFFVFGESEETGPAIARIDLDAEGIPFALTLRSIRYRY